MERKAWKRFSYGKYRRKTTGAFKPLSTDMSVEFVKIFPIIVAPAICPGQNQMLTINKTPPGGLRYAIVARTINSG